MMDRPLYMKRLLACKDSPEIKVLTGIRRVGKSVLLDLFEKELVALGVGRAHILRVNLENLRWRGNRSQTALYDLMSRRIPARERTYLLMDEVQAVEDW
ncbi:MAG: AAA family ATPase, partial [Selenomonadaceae bacterium]|nr:AAA family ATPase [Selenomonadaceae bacterium]